MARPKGSKDKGNRTRYNDETKACMAAVVAAVGATKAQRIFKAMLGKKTPSIPTLCNIAAAHKVPLSRGAEIDLDPRDVLAALLNERGLTGTQEALSCIVDGKGKPAMKVPSLVTLAKVADEYAIKRVRGRHAAEAA